MDNKILWNTDIFADMVNSNEKIISLCEEVKGALPSFSCLSECGLFSEGLSSIEKMTSSLEESVNGLSQIIKQHNESIVSRENKIENLYKDTPFISLGNVENFKNYAMGTVPFLAAATPFINYKTEQTNLEAKQETSNKTTSKIITYEEYKEKAKKFAQEKELPEMSEQEMKEAYASYITKQPITPKTEIKSMKEEITPIQEVKTPETIQSQKTEQTKDLNYSSKTFEEAQIERNQETIIPNEETKVIEGTKVQQDRYNKTKNEQTKDLNYSSKTFEEAQIERNQETIIPNEETKVIEEAKVQQDRYNEIKSERTDYSSNKNSSNLLDNNKDTLTNENIKNTSNEDINHIRDLNQSVERYQESYINNKENNQTDNIFIDDSQEKSTKEIYNDIINEDLTRNNSATNENTIFEEKKNYENSDILDNDIKETNNDWVNIAGVGVAGLGALGLNNLLKNKREKSKKDTETDND